MTLISIEDGVKMAGVVERAAFVAANHPDGHQAVTIIVALDAGSLREVQGALTDCGAVAEWLHSEKGAHACVLPNAIAEAIRCTDWSGRFGAQLPELIRTLCFARGMVVSTAFNAPTKYMQDGHPGH
jgi:hypothetical protein